jgi:Spy/CpxP family protein refolding chaperone
MNLQKKHMIIGAIVISVLILASFGLVVADGTRGVRGEETRYGFHRRPFHHGFHGKDMADFFMARMDSRIAFLELNETQRQTYEEIKAKIKAHMEEGIADRKALMEEIRSEMNQETPDINAVSETIKQRINKMTASMEEGLDLFVDFYNMLDDNQKAQLIEKLRDRMGPIQR